MGQHATIHGKNTTETNGQTGIWIPIQVNNAGQTVIAPLNGENSSAGRLFGGMAVKKFSLTADGLPTGWVGPGWVTAIRCLTAGTIAGLYDATSAAGTNLIPALVMAANAKEALSGAGEAVYFDTSPFFDITGGTYIVFGIN